MRSPVAKAIVRRMRDGCIAITREGSLPQQVPQNVPIQAAPQLYQYKAVAKEPEQAPQPPAVVGIQIAQAPEEVEAVTPVIRESKGARKLQDLRMKYPLIPREPGKGEPVFALANIGWSSKAGELVYNVVEPSITAYDMEVIDNTKKILEEKLDIDFFKLGEIKAKELLSKEIDNIIAMNPNLDPRKAQSIKYYLERDIVGLGKVEPLMNDPNIEDISCDGINIPLYVYHRNPDIGSLKTNVIFTNADELNSFVVKIAQRAKKSISIAEPLLDASLPGGSRIQATLGTDIARKGSNFTIRKFAEDPLTPTHMLRYGTLNSTQLAYLWMAIDNGQSILISGGTATGKTSLLNALSLFIRHNLKIVSIEDTPELRLPHPHWIPEVARTPLSIKGTVGEVTLFDLLKSSLRQRPDYIVMGEVRGEEAFVLFQQMATGHPSLATIHAASINQLIDRLTTPPISLPPSLLGNISVIVFLTMSRLEGRHVRRADKILEVTGISKSRPVTSDVFRWDPKGDEFKIGERSVVLKAIANRMAFNEEGLKEELSRRRDVLEWMHQENIYNYQEVARTISAYNNNPERVMEAIRGQY
jgi:flagellar protein FlaI